MYVVKDKTVGASAAFMYLIYLWLKTQKLLYIVGPNAMMVDNMDNN